MKKIYTHFLILLIVSVLFSCKKEESNVPVVNTSGTNNPNQPPSGSSATKLFTLDTAKIYQYSINGTNEQTIVNRKIGNSSYINDLSLSADGSEFVYIDVQGASNGTVYIFTHQIRIFDLEKSSDNSIYSTTDAIIFVVKYCADGKIFFATKNKLDNDIIKYYIINSDGTGLKESQGYFTNLVDITSSRRFMLLSIYTLGSPPSVSIVDSTLDGGTGTYHSEFFSSSDYVYDGTFSPNGKKVVIPFLDGTDINIRIVDMDTKTATTRTIVSGVGQYSFAGITIANDNNSVALCVPGNQSKEKSKIYLFKLDDTAISSFDAKSWVVNKAYIY